MTPPAARTLTRPLALVLLSALPWLGCGGGNGPTDPPPTGTLEIQAATTGDTLDADGYTVTLDGDVSRSLAVDGSVVIEDVEEGSHEVELSGVQVNCDAAGENPRTVSVEAGGTASATFELSCEAALFDRLAFRSFRDGISEIYTIRPDGTDLERVTEHTANQSQPTWSPDGNRLAFRSDRDGNTEIYTIRPDGTDLERVTDDPADDFHPAWSPDGDRLAFYSFPNANFDVYTIDPEGNGLERVTDHAANDLEPTWSPDGTRLAFSSDRDGFSEIYTISPQGNDVEQVTDNSVADSHPAWGPAR